MPPADAIEGRWSEQLQAGPGVTVPELNNGAALLKVQFKAGEGSMLRAYSSQSDEPKKRTEDEGDNDGVAITGPVVE